MRIGIGLIGATLCWAVLTRNAQAQTFGERGQLAVSAERLYGVTHSVYSQNAGIYDGVPRPEQSSIQRDSINLLGTPQPAVYNAPRAAFDYFVARHLSLGGAVSYAAVAQSSGGLLSLAGRVGYVSMFTSSAGIWVRGGVTHERYSSDLRWNAQYTALTLEAPFVLSPVPRVAFTFGPTLDIGIGGTVESGPPQRVTELGLEGGLMVYLL